ncbi:MAG: hypothetical protein ACLRFK_01255 [Alphaproteobacteria bacterium]
MKKLFAFLSFVFITQIAMADDIVCDSANTVYVAVYKINTYDCPSGYYLPANTDGCQPCLYGRYCAGGTYTFNTDADQGIVIGSYVCNSGYFLPANTDQCKPCPSGFNCPGGTFQFNPDMFQGLYFTENITTTMNNVCAANFPTDIFAIYEANKHDCATGFYMPANTDGCVICPENNYCPGGAYTFNETIAQGITICPENAPFAPIGMWTKLQCGRKLHIDDDVLYVHQEPANPTEHRLYIRVNDTVYSANATPKQNSSITKTSINATQLLHIVMDGIEYLIHDDSVR